MATWVYKCDECEITSAVEIEDGAEAPATAICPHCGSAGAEKKFELPKMAGGCSCGNEGCC